MSKKSEAIFGLQCFWGSEVRFGTVNGVISTSVGYTGGSTPDPTYKNLSDHTEVVKVVFDPKLVSYQQLLDIFWSSHDPTDTDYSRQYWSIIFFVDEQQKQLAEKSLEDKQKQSAKPIVTKIVALNVFYLAEDYHQKHFLKKYPSVVSELKLTDKELTDSPVATRLNGFCAGFGSIEQLDKELKSLGIKLSDENETIIKDLIRDGINLGEC